MFYTSRKRFLYVIAMAVFSFICSDSYEAGLVVSEGESVYDFCWYPYMTASGASIEFYLLEFFILLYMLTVLIIS